MKVSLHLTQNCNLRCSYCYGGDKSEISMSETIAERAIDFIVKENDSPYLVLTFFGGEPLLRFKLIEKIVRDTKHKIPNNVKVRFAINTNGTILSPRIATLLRENHFHIIVSLDGDRESHNAHRVFPNGEGSFFVIEKNIATFLKINPYLVTISVITPENVSRLTESVKFLVNKNIRLVLVTPDYTAPWDRKSFRELKRAYQKLARFYIKLHRQRRKIFLNLFDERIKTHVERNRPVNICKLADTEFSIAPDGTIFPCVQFVNSETIKTKKWAVGHIETGWDRKERERIIRLSRELPQECMECDLNGRCTNYCGCLNVRTTGKINQVSPFRCEHERMIFPIADKTGNTLFKEKNELFLHKFYNPHYSVLSVLEDGL